MRTHTKHNSQRIKPILLSPNDAINRLGRLLVLDVQNPRFATHMIPKAQRLGVDIVLNDIPKTQSILLTCLTGERSLTAARQLVDKGYVAVHVLKGGVFAWQHVGYMTQLTKLPA